VTTSSSFHFWEHHAACLSEVRRVLKPNGILLITDWSHDFFSCKICSLYLRVAGHPREAWNICSLEELRNLLLESGFDILLEDAYLIRLRMATIGPRWGMLTFVANANKQALSSEILKSKL
jgi:ubiquinone/menaquinone biosynthesis C-methylase UbiE